MPADTCSRRQHRQAGPHKRIGFLARGNQGRYSSIVPGHWTYLYGVLAGSVKYNAGLRSRTFGSRNPALRISKGTMPAAYRRRLYCDYGCDFGYDDAPGPGCRDYPRHDLLRGGTPHSQPRRHLLQVPDRHSSHRRVHGSDHVPAASVSATARPTASPAAAMTGKSGGVIFRACTYGFRQGQFRNLPLDKLLDTVEFTLLLLVHERNGPPVALARAVRPMRWI